MEFDPSASEFTAVDHVQVACPPGGEEQARQFYSGLLGMTEQEKPAALRARGLEVVTGVFGAHMAVELVNDGPVTILLESAP